MYMHVIVLRSCRFWVPLTALCGNLWSCQTSHSRSTTQKLKKLFDSFGEPVNRAIALGRKKRHSKHVHVCVIFVYICFYHSSTVPVTYDEVRIACPPGSFLFLVCVVAKHELRPKVAQLFGVSLSTAVASRTLMNKREKTAKFDFNLS